MKNIQKLCRVLSLLLVVAFPVKLACDYAVYSSTLNSAPFYLWVIVDGLYFLLPALVLFIVGWLLRRNGK